MSLRRSNSITAASTALLGLLVHSALAAALGLAILSILPLRAGGAQVPGPESFARQPQTPLELWDAADYLIRTGQASRAEPYLKSFLAANPDDATLLEVRDRYGAGSFLRLEDNPATQPYAADIAGRVNAAAVRRARDPGRLDDAIQALNGSPGEQSYGLRRLREAGPYAVPALVSAIQKAGANRQPLADALGRLDRTSVPALVTVLDAPDAQLAADAATALARINDPRAVPYLLHPAGTSQDDPLRRAARDALSHLTGHPEGSPGRSPAAQLRDEARGYLAGHSRIEGEPEVVQLWTWQGDAPVPSNLPKRDAEIALGLKFARQAQDLEPNDPQAKALIVALNLDDAVRRQGIDAFLTSPLPATADGPVAEALAAGPDVLKDVLVLALQQGRGDLSAATSRLLGQIVDRSEPNDQAVLRSDPPLVQALASPDARTQLTAAHALANMNLRWSVPGTSQVVPILARALSVGYGAPRAIVVDPAPNRGNAVGASLQGLGYEVLHAPDGRDAFREASDNLNVSVILVEPTTLGRQGTWSGRDLLTNLRADARTANIPVLFYGPLGLDTRGMSYSSIETQNEQVTVGSGASRLHNPLGRWILDTPRAAFVPTPTNADAFRPILERELKRLGAPLPIPANAAPAYALAAAKALERIGATPGSPFASALPAAQPALLEATRSTPEVTAAAVAALGHLPGADAQRRAAELLLDPSRDATVHSAATSALVDSLQRFGPLVTADQEKSLLAAARDAGTTLERRAELSRAVQALRPSSASAPATASSTPAAQP
jgi:hypothetical protein